MFMGNAISPRLRVCLAVGLPLVLPCGTSGAADSVGAMHGLVFRACGTEAGLPQNTVTAAVQSREGYLWLGTRDGLARFDGVRFKVFGLQEGLQSVEVQSLLEDRGGTLWIGSYGGGLARLIEGRAEVVPVSNRRAGRDIVTVLAEDSTGRLWVGTRAGLLFLQHGRLVEDASLGELSRTPIRALMRDRRGAMWIATSNRGLFEYQRGQLTPCTGPLPDPRIIAHCLLEDRRGWLWASIGNGMVLCRRDGEWQIYNETHGLPFAYVACLGEDADGTVWAGSLDDGLYYFDGERFHAVRQTDGLSANDIRSLLLDRESNLWDGTRTGGLNRLSRRKLVHCGAAQGLTNDFTRSVAETADGKLWVATTGGGLYQGNLHDLAPFRPEPVGGYYAHVESVLAAKDGSVWWGGANALLRWKNDRLLNCVTNEPWVQASSVTALREDPEGGLWIGTSEGRLVHFHGDRFTEFPEAVARGSVTALAVQPDGQVWVGSVAGGLKRIREGSDSILTVTKGLLSHSIRTLYLDAEGALWIGTTGGGLSCWREGRVSSFTEAQGLNVRTVSQIIEDDAGYLWLGTSRGVIKVRKSDLAECAAGRLGFVHARTYGVNDGMPAEECSGGFCPAGLKMQNGLVCFSTVKGLVLIDPREQSATAPPPETLLEEVLVNGQAQPPAAVRSRADDGESSSAPLQRLMILPGGRAVELHYTAIQFNSPERVGFRYRLEDVEADWIVAGGRRAAYYPHLSPGDYLFRVQSCNAEGVWSDRQASLAITVRPFFYETRWFRMGVALALVGVSAGALWFVMRRRYQRRLARLQMQHAVERERLRISQDMHDHVGGILTQVSQLSDMGQSEAEGALLVKHRFERIGHQVRGAVQALDEIVWATNPRNDNLASFAEYGSRFSDEFFEGTNIRCWQEVPTTLPQLPLRAEVRHNVFLALREAFNNVLKHSKATEVWLRVSLIDAGVSLEVEDNGYGFNPAQTAPHGNGLDNMKSRLAECGGRTTLTSTPGEGTKVQFTFAVVDPG